MGYSDMKSAMYSLAMLMENYNQASEKKKDYYQYFIPLVVESLRTYQHPVVAVTDLQDHFFERFKIKIPKHVLLKLIKKCTRQGYVERTGDNIYRVIRDSVDTSDFTEKNREVERSFNSLLNHLIQFCSDKFGVQWTLEVAEVALEKFVADNDLELLNALLGHEKGTYNVEQFGSMETQDVNTDEAKYFVGRFVKFLLDDDRSELELLAQVVKGYFLTSVMFLPDDRNTVEKYWTTEVYFDTEFLLQALGYSGEEFKSQAEELINALRQANARLRCFRHNRDEIHGIMYSTHSFLISGNYKEAKGPMIQTLKALYKREYTPADVLYDMTKLDNVLEERIGVRVVDKPAYVRRFQIDEGKFSQALGDYSRDRAKDVDVNSISAVARLRKLQSYEQVEHCCALFVTTNSYLQRVTRREFRQSDEVPYCMTDYALMNLVWLRSPDEVKDLPKKRLIAMCSAAIRPNSRLWHDFIKRVESLKTSGDVSFSDVAVFRVASEAEDALMEVTHGIETELSQGTIFDIIEKTRQKISDETYDKYVSEREKREAIEGKLEDERSTRTRQLQQIRQDAEDRACVVIQILEALLVITLITGTLGSWYLDSASGELQILRPGLRTIVWLAITGAGLITIFFVRSSVTGWQVDLQKKLADRFEADRKRMLHIE